MRLHLLLLPLLLLGCPSPKRPEITVKLDGSRQGVALGFVDFDGDGVEDKVVGAPFGLHEGRRGMALVYPGLKKGAFAALPMAALTGGNSLGASFVKLGDVDGDKRADFALGAPHADGEATGMSGNVVVFRGGKGGAVLTTLAAGEPTAKFGYSLAAGDFDADGAQDLAVGAPFDTPEAALFQAGAVYVFFGPDFARVHAVRATQASRGLGWALAAGDVSGDGVADLILGAAGKVLAFHGGAGFAPGADAAQLTVKSAAGGFGRALAVIGDWDHDGAEELAIGAPTASVGGNRDVGALFVVRGGSEPRTVDTGASPAPAALLASVNGAALFDRFGASLAAVEDVDGDGTPELAVGAPLSDQAVGDLTGRVYLFKSGAALELTQAAAFPGTERSGWFGACLSAASGGRLLVASPRAQGEAGAVTMLDLRTGETVKSGSSGGTSGSSGCHCDETGECHC